MLQGSDSETIIVKIADLLSTYGVLPALLGGTILAGILASTMSTADSQLLAASSAVSSDLLGSILKKKADKKESMVADRVTLLLIAVVAVIIARNPDSSVFNIVSFAWAGFRCCIRTGCTVCFVLATYQLAGCTGRNDFRRCYGIRMEISGSSKCVFPEFL